MTSNATVTDHSRAELDSENITFGGGPENSRASRIASTDPADFAVPTGQEEEWRFAPLKALGPLLETVPTGQDVAVSVDAADGVAVTEIAADDPLRGRGGLPEDRLTALAWAGSTGATLVDIPAEAEVDGFTKITTTGTGRAPTAQHLVVRAGRHSKAIVVLDHVGNAVLGQNVEMIVEDGAQLLVLSIQDWDDEAVHGSGHHAQIGRDASLKHVVVTFGGKAVRMMPSSRFAGPGGEVEMLGLYFSDDAQHLEHRLFVDHAAPNCTSNVTYKGALQGEGARAVWIGDVLIRKEAEGTDTYELNRNLVLTEGARADSVPNLEIETGEIEGAGHASATGRFDDEQLYYLMSRGIAEKEARRLVVRGFFAEVIQRIGLPEVQERLLESIERELARSMQ